MITHLSPCPLATDGRDYATRRLPTFGCHVSRLNALCCEGLLRQAFKKSLHPVFSFYFRALDFSPCAPRSIGQSGRDCCADFLRGRLCSQLHSFFRWSLFGRDFLSGSLLGTGFCFWFTWFCCHGLIRYSNLATQRRNYAAQQVGSPSRHR